DGVAQRFAVRADDAISSGSGADEIALYGVVGIVRILHPDTATLIAGDDIAVTGSPNLVAGIGGDDVNAGPLVGQSPVPGDISADLIVLQRVVGCPLERYAPER